MLDNADLVLGQVEDENGETLNITHANIPSLLQKQDRRVRREAFETFYAAYAAHQYTFASLLSGSVKKDQFFAQARGYGSVRKQALFTENIPISVYDNLVKTVLENLAPLYKYYALRKKILGLEDLHVYDTHVPLVKNIQWCMPYEEAVGPG